ncbi:hypothetical protein RAA17_21335 [Komagataeibacter rhaeticus]|nr:hypothetical protein [Komagataeibacter rhaeticus]
MNASTLLDNAAIGVFVLCFVATIVLGSTVRLWRPFLNRRKTATRHTADEEWGLGGREFGAWVTWFLVGAISIPPIPSLPCPPLSIQRGLRLLCPALYHHRLSVHFRGHAPAVDHRA